MGTAPIYSPHFSAAVAASSLQSCDIFVTQTDKGTSGANTPYTTTSMTKCKEYCLNEPQVGIVFVMTVLHTGNL